MSQLLPLTAIKWILLVFLLKRPKSIYFMLHRNPNCCTILPTYIYRTYRSTEICLIKNLKHDMEKQSCHIILPRVWPTTCHFLGCAWLHFIFLQEMHFYRSWIVTFLQKPFWFQYIRFNTPVVTLEQPDAVYKITCNHCD